MNDEIREIISRNNFVILDTETTGLRRPAEIIDIAVIDPSGYAVLETLLNPRGPIPGEASAIHGITKEMTFGCPEWPSVKRKLIEVIKGKDVLVYNAKYDRHMMHCSDEMWDLGNTDYHGIATWHCVMLAYADFHGEWDDYHGNNRWQKLTTACELEGVTVQDAHRAIGDCRMTLDLLRTLTEDLPVWNTSHSA